MKDDILLFEHTGFSDWLLNLANQCRGTENEVSTKMVARLVYNMVCALGSSFVFYELPFFFLWKTEYCQVLV